LYFNHAQVNYILSSLLNWIVDLSVCHSHSSWCFKAPGVTS